MSVPTQFSGAPQTTFRQATPASLWTANLADTKSTSACTSTPGTIAVSEPSPLDDSKIEAELTRLKAEAALQDKDAEPRVVHGTDPWWWALIKSKGGVTLFCMVILGAIYDERRHTRYQGPTELDRIAPLGMRDLSNELHSAFQERKKTEPNIVLSDFAQEYLTNRGYLVLDDGFDLVKQESWVGFRTAHGEPLTYMHFPNRKKDN
jgi:hypothetical protein